MVVLPVDKQDYYRILSINHANEAKLRRCRASIHVEYLDDKTFWQKVFKHFYPQDKFNFIYGSRNFKGNDTSGVEQCLHYRNFLNKDFFICIDSDFRYLLQTPTIDKAHFICQTYTHSIENHYCYSSGLDTVCKNACHLENTLFDFIKFLKDYSNIIYELFLWHLYFLKADESLFTKPDFNEIISIRNSGIYPDINNQAKAELEHVKQKVITKLSLLNVAHKAVDIEKIKKQYQGLGLTPDNTYLFIRGHDIFDTLVRIEKKVCDRLGDNHKKTLGNDNAKITAFFNAMNKIETQFERNLQFGKYSEIIKLEYDVTTFFN